VRTEAAASSSSIAGSKQQQTAAGVGGKRGEGEGVFFQQVQTKVQFSLNFCVKKFSKKSIKLSKQFSKKSKGVRGMVLGRFVNKMRPGVFVLSRWLRRKRQIEVEICSEHH